VSIERTYTLQKVV